MKRKLYKLSLFKEIDEFNQRDSDGHYSDDSSDDFLNTTLTAYESQIFIQSSNNIVQSEQLQFIQGVFDKSDSERSFDIINIESDNRTTLMMRNIPVHYTKETLINEIDSKFKNKFDYFNFIIDGTSNYAFINLKQKSYVKDFYNYFNGRKWKNSNKPCYLKYAKIQHKKFKQINPQIYLQQSSVIKLIQSQKLQCNM